MSLLEEPSQKETEICLHEDQEDQTDKDATVITNQKEKTNLLSLIKRDLLKVFQNKDVKEEHEDDPSNQTDNKTTDSSTFSHLEEDQSPFKENLIINLSQDKEVMFVDPEVSQTTDKSTNLLSLFKEDLFMVFRGKALKKEHKDAPSNQTENKTIDSSTFSLLEEDLTHSEEDLPQDKDVKSEDPKPSQTTDKAMNPLSLIKEDGPKGFKNKDVKEEHEDDSSNQTDNKTTDSSTFSLLEEDQSLFKDNLNINSSQDGPMNQAENSGTCTTLSLLKEDQSPFKEDLPQDKEVMSVDPEVSQTTDKSTNLLSLFKEDLVKVFRGKALKEEHKDTPSNQTENKTTDSSTFSLLEEDQSLFKDNLNINSSQDGPMNQAENSSTCTTLSLLKEDQSPFKEDLPQDKEVMSVDPEVSQTTDKSTNLLSLFKEDLVKVFRGKALKKEHKDTPSNQTENKTTDSSTFSLLEEDQSLFKDNLHINSTQDRDLKKEHEDGPMNQAENSGTCSALSLLKEDLTAQDKEVMPVDPKPSRTAKKSLNCLSLLKEDLVKVFRGKALKKEHKDAPSNQTENKTIDSSTFSLLKEDLTHSEEDLPQDKDVKSEDPKPSQTTDKAMNPLSLIKEDGPKGFKNKDVKDEHEDDSSNQTDNKTTDSSTFSLLEEDQSLFKDNLNINLSQERDVKKEHEDGPMNQAENSDTCTTLSLLKEDLSQFKEDLPQDKEVMSVDPEVSQTTDKSTNLLSLLKEDFSVFKDDLSKVFSIIHSKEKDNKEDSSKIKNLKTATPDELFKSLFNRDNPLSKSQSVEDSQKVKETLPGKKEEQLDSGLRGTGAEEQNKEKLISGKKNSKIKDGVSQTGDGERDVNVPGTTSFSETQSEEETPAAQTAEQGAEGGLCSDGHSSVVSAGDETIKEETEDKPENLPWETLFSRISLLKLTNANKDHLRCQPGRDPWSPKNFATYLTFDPSTANSELHLTDSNRKATRVWSDHRSSEHPDRFERCPQVLCREGLLDTVYWEVEWSGGADIGVTYNSISRDGDMESCLLGHYEWSWSLECSEGIYTPCYNNKRFTSSSPEPFTHRVGVYLDWTAGSLSFYCVSQDTVVHLHTFTSTFTEPLYPGFWVWAYDGSVSLCQVALDWELLLL